MVAINFPLPMLYTIPDDVWEMDYREGFRYDMACMHNCLLRHFNSIHAYADTNAVAQDVDGFLTYIDAFYLTTTYHHRGEELILFPRLGKDIAEMSNNLEQHHAIHNLLQDLKAFVTSVREDKSSYSAKTLREILEKYAGDFHQHLTDEIKTLEPERLKKVISDDDLKADIRREIDWVVEKTGPPVVVPFMFGGHDVPTNPTWPAIPDEVKQAIPVLMQVHKSAWKFAPYEADTGKAQPVMA